MSHIYFFLLCSSLAFLLANWSVSIDNTSTTSIRFSWQNLETLGRQISHYFVVIKNSFGSSLIGYLVQKNTISHLFYGLSAYSEYRLSVVGADYSGNAYKTTEITAWTDEGGTCIIKRRFVGVEVTHYCNNW